MDHVFDITWKNNNLQGAAYVGSFAETDDLSFYVSDPNISVGRGSWLGDTVGYSQKEGTYYLQWPDGFEEEIPNDLIVGEYEAVNGKALLIKGEPATGPSSWPAEGMYAIILNIPNGPVTGGSFHEKKTLELSEKELIDFIATITFTVETGLPQ